MPDEQILDDNMAGGDDANLPGDEPGDEEKKEEGGDELGTEEEDDDMLGEEG